MARILLLICLACAVVVLVGAAMAAVTRAAREGRSLARGLAPIDEGNTMKRISYAALLLLMLGVTSGLLGGL